MKGGERETDVCNERSGNGGVKVDKVRAWWVVRKVPSGSSVLCSSLSRFFLVSFAFPSVHSSLLSSCPEGRRKRGDERTE